MFLCKSALRIRILLVFLPALLIGCGGGASISPTPVLTPQFAYVANFTSNNISAYTINAGTGALTAVGSPIAAGSGPAAVTVHPSGKFAYVANFDSNDVSAFTINASTGSLTPVGPPVAAGNTPASVTVDPS